MGLNSKGSPDSLNSLDFKKQSSLSFISDPSSFLKKKILEPIEISTCKTNANSVSRDRPERQRVGQATFMEWRTLDKILKKDRIELREHKSVTPIEKIRPRVPHGSVIPPIGSSDCEWLRANSRMGNPVVGIPPSDLSLAQIDDNYFRVISEWKRINSKNSHTSKRMTRLLPHRYTKMVPLMTAQKHVVSDV
jgi:hypothetical protein